MIDVASRFIREVFEILRTADKGTFYYYLAAIIVTFPKIMRSRSLAPADKKMAPRNCCFRPFGKKIIISGQHFGLAREIYCSKFYFIPAGFEIPENGVVIDLGANVGIFTILAALHARKVIAVEAQSEFLGLIENNLKKNGCFENVIIEHGIIGARSGVFSNEENLRAASHFRLFPQQLSIPDILKRHDIGKVDFLKIDIEGSEFDLFKEDTSWLEKTGKIAMEVHLEYGNLNEIIKTLKSYEFIIWLVNKNRKIVSHLKEPIGYLFARRA